MAPSQACAPVRVKVSLTAQEAEGLGLFEGNGKCANCHVSKLGPKGELPLFTDFTFYWIILGAGCSAGYTFPTKISVLF